MFPNPFTAHIQGLKEDVCQDLGSGHFQEQSRVGAGAAAGGTARLPQSAGCGLG